MAEVRKFSVLLGIALVAVMVMGIGASRVVAAKPRMAIVFATGGLGDKSFNDSAYDGMRRAEKELGIEFDKVEPQAVAEYESLLMRFAQTRKYDLIISIGFDQADASGRVGQIPGSSPSGQVPMLNVVCAGREAERGFVVAAGNDR